MKNIILKLRRMGVSVALICITATAVAQTIPGCSWRFSERFPSNPPMKFDLDKSLLVHSQPNGLQIPQESIQEKDTIRTQSVMFHQIEKNPPMQYHYKYRPDYTKMVDNLGGIRDQIVRKRRWNEGRPLQPIPPMR